jgi:acetyltransferase-like isoleucine patch superfamily enzyme
MSIKDKIKSNPGLKKLVHWMLVSDARPRLWVKLFINPFVHKRGRGASVRRARLDVLPFNKFNIGKKTIIEDHCVINNGVGDVFIGNNTLIGIGNVIIGPVTIGNNVIFAQHIVLSGLNHEYRDINTPIVDQKVTVAPIVVEDDCWIAANSVITSGVTIGKHSVVAGGSVVTKDVPPYSVVAGNPAKLIRQYDPKTGNWERV